MTELGQIDSLAEALVDANDLLLGMYDLADATARSLDERCVVADLLERALRIVDADQLAFTTSSGVTCIKDEQRHPPLVSPR